MKTKWFNEKTVIITGASSGFGKILSTKLIKNYGCKVIGIARTLSKLEQLKKELGDNFSFYAFDAGNQQNWESLASTLKEQNIQVDILINNAGVLPPFCKFDKMPSSSIESVMQTNFFASVYSIKALIVQLKQSKTPAIINVASSAALATVAGSTGYSASKSALKSFTQSLILEYPEIYVSIVCPGFAKTDIFRSQAQTTEKESKLINAVCSSPDKMVNSMINAIAKKKKRVVLGLDAHAMDIFGRIMPKTTDKLIYTLLKKANISLFNDVFNQ